MLGVDDALLAEVGPRVRAGGGEAGAELGGEREQAPAAVALGRERGEQVLPAAGADLDLGRDQLARERLGKRRVGLRGVAQLLEALREVERRRVEDRELLLEPDGAVGRLREQLGGGVEVEAQRLR